MSKKVRLISLLVILFSTLTLSWFPTFAQGCEIDSYGQLYCPQTGHWITGDFARTYKNTPDPLKLFGYPITEAYQQQNIGRIVQYFERARFELYPENPSNLRVVITPLGKYLYQSGPELQVPDNFPACKFFSETGFSVCYAFLDFFNENGSTTYLGYPISNFEFHDGRIVQYFQRARLEWHPDFPPNQRVILSDLGSLYFHTIGENPSYLLPIQNDNIPQPVLDLTLRAFPQSAVLPQEGNQTIYVIVQDQNLLPVSGAMVTLKLTLPSGRSQNIIIPEATNQEGITKYSFNYSGEPTGLAKVVLSAAYNRLQKQTVTSFRIWW